MLHYDLRDTINDVSLNIYNIKAEIAKPLMRLYVVCPGSIATLPIILRRASLYQISTWIRSRPFKTPKHPFARFWFVVKNPLYLPASNSSAIKAQPSSWASTIITQFFSNPEPVLSIISVLGSLISAASPLLPIKYSFFVSGAIAIYCSLTLLKLLTVWNNDNNTNLLNGGFILTMFSIPLLSKSIFCLDVV